MNKVPDIEVAVFFLKIGFSRHTEMLSNLFSTFLKKKKYKMPTSPILQLVDEASGIQRALLEEFAFFYFDSVVERVYPSEFIFYTKEELKAFLASE